MGKTDDLLKRVRFPGGEIEKPPVQSNHLVVVARVPAEAWAKLEEVLQLLREAGASYEVA